MHDRGHQAQYAASALEFLDTRPIGVEAVEEFGMNGIGVLETPLILCLPAGRGKFRGLAAIEIHESPHNGISRYKERRIDDVLKEPSPHDFEALFCICGSPGGLNTSKDVFEAYGCLTSTFASCFGIGGGNGSDHQGLWRRLRCLGERLGKTQVGIERAARHNWHIV